MSYDPLPKRASEHRRHPALTPYVQSRRSVVTAVVPAWDLGELLEHALASVQRQACVDRIVIVDNASTEDLDPGQAEVVRTDRRLTVGAARNVGLALVDAPYVCFMDGDDILLPGALDRLVPLLEARPDAVAAAGAIQIWNPTDGSVVPSYYPPRLASQLQGHPRVFGLVNSVVNLFPPVGGTVVRTDAARAVGGFPDLDYLETWCFGLALSLIGPTLLDARPAKLYRVQPARTSLKASGAGHVRHEWTGRACLRATVRQILRGPHGHVLSACLLPLHTAQFLLALRQARHPAMTYLRERAASQ